MSLMNTELQLKLSNDEHNDDERSRSSSNNSNSGVDVRKIYVLEGHGVPIQLLSHLIQAVQSWTTSTTTTTTSNNNKSSSSSNNNTSQSSSQIVQISFENIHNTTMLNRDVIQIMYANGNTTVGSQQQQFIMGTTEEEENNDWEHDFELYMVVMDRIASRLASIVLFGNDTENGEVAATTATATDSILGSSGSMITPASLKRWNVTMMKGEALPLSLLRKEKEEGLRRQEHRYKQSIFLTVEWVMKNRGRDCCNIVLRLQNDGMVQDDSGGSSSGTKRGSGRDPISLVFDGVYEQ